MRRNQRGHAFPDMSYRAGSLDTTIGGRPRARWSSPRPAFSGSAGRAGSHPLCFKRRRACLNSRQHGTSGRSRPGSLSPRRIYSSSGDKFSPRRASVCAPRGRHPALALCVRRAPTLRPAARPGQYSSRRFARRRLYMERAGKCCLLDGAGGRDGRFSSLVTRQAPVNAVDVFYNNRPRTESSTALRSRCLRGSRQFREQNVANLCRN